MSTRISQLTAATSLDGSELLEIVQAGTSKRGTAQQVSRLAAELYAATSTTSLAIGTGSKSLTTQTYLAYRGGAFVTISDANNPDTNYMSGIVTSYAPTTGAMTVNVTVVAGSGTIANWNIQPSGTQGIQGNPGAPWDGWHGAWLTATAYVSNDAVDNDGASYICTADHTSGASTEPGTGASWASYWDVLAEKGDTGTAATISVGTVTTGAAGSSASVTNVGTSSAAVFNFAIPRGDTGAAWDGWQGAWLTATAYALSDAVENNGSSYICTQAHTSGAASEPGTGGSWASYWDVLAEKGADGAGTGDVVGPASATDNAVARFDGTTGKMIQNSTVTIADTTGAIAGTGAITPASNDGGALGSASLSFSDLFLATGGTVNWNNGAVTITHSANTLAFAGASSGYTLDSLVTVTSSSASALAVGANGSTNPVLKVDASTVSVATGISVTGAAAAGRAAVAVLSSGTNEGLSIDAKGSGTIRLGATSTGAVEFSRNAVPTSSDGAALGTTSLMWSDIFIASGGVINWDAGDVTITHSANALAIAGADSGVNISHSGAIENHVLTTTHSGNGIKWSHGNTNFIGSLGALSGGGAPFVALHAEHGTTANTLRNSGAGVKGMYFAYDGTTLDIKFNGVATAGADFSSVVTGLSMTTAGAATFASNVSATNILISSGGAVNFNSGDVTITHSANLLAFAGATSGYTFDGDIKFGGTKTLGLGGGSVSSNTVFGVGALASNTTGYQNVAIGDSSLAAATVGYQNIAIGSDSLKVLTTGYRNVSIGYAAMDANTTGYDNTAVGANALGVCTIGFRNVAVGVDALQALTIGNNNAGVGNNALFSLTTGIWNIAMGTSALHLCTTGSNNVGIGVHALYNCTTGQYNTAVGSSALDACTTGSYLVGIGGNALLSNTTGANNVAVGYGALQNNTTGSNNMALGRTALQLNTYGDGNSAIGYAALNSNTTGNNNIGIGSSSLASATYADDNVAIGVVAMTNATTGAANVAIGRSALRYATTGTRNTVVGAYAYNASAAAITGTDNTVIGYGAETSAGAVGTIAIGSGAASEASTGSTSGDHGPTIAVGSTSYKVGFRGDGTPYASAGASAGYLRIKLNGTKYKVQIYADT